MTLGQYKQAIERALDQAIPENASDELSGLKPPRLLTEAMRYSLLAGGKRLRPAMLLATVDMLGGDTQEAMAAACAIEMIHTYSLIHDDLPGMDDDTLRRGRPTSHVVYGEGQAILAGDGLLNMAYEEMLENALRYPDHLTRHVRAIGEIGACAGARGMVGGQSIDLLCEKGGVVHDEATLQYIHLSKTACLFLSAMRAGALIAGADEEALGHITRYARAFGLMFQTADDLLDVEGDAEALGKSTGKDAAGGKLTAVSLYGAGGANERVKGLFDEGMEALAHFGEKGRFFAELLEQMLGRKT